MVLSLAFNLCVSFLFLAGVVDEDYRGNVGVVLFNFAKTPFVGMCWLLPPGVLKVNNSQVMGVCSG